jgi:RimJ/RimL family protein N-acetyltransferase
VVQVISSIPGVHLFAILNLSDALIGDIDLQVISGSGGMAWMSIEIGDREYWGHGYGTDAISALLRHAFRRLNIRQVRLNVKKFNARAIRCYEKCGFVRESEQRDEYLMVAMAESCEL